MNQLEQSIRDICAAHNLHSFGINLLLPNDENGAGWDVTVQRWAGNMAIGCWSGSGNSIPEALAKALARVPTVELADEPLLIGEAV